MPEYQANGILPKNEIDVRAPDRAMKGFHKSGFHKNFSLSDVVSQMCQGAGIGSPILQCDKHTADLYVI